MYRDVLRPAVLMLLVFTLLTGLAYPLVVTGLAQALFPAQAKGSLVEGEDGAIVGSALIGQSFTDPKYFWGRPSATAPSAYNAAASAGSNLGPTNPALAAGVQKRIAELKAADPSNDEPVPADLATASGSGLDPHISVAAAAYQVRRVARARNLDEEAARQLVARNTNPRTWGVLGEPRVNVLQLNLALDAVSQSTPLRVVRP